MKPKTFLKMAVVVLFTAACSHDNDYIMSVADSVIGTYNGTLDMTVAGNSAGSSELST